MHDPLSNQCGSSRAAVRKPRPSGGYHEAIQPTCRGECGWQRHFQRCQGAKLGSPGLAGDISNKSSTGASGDTSTGAKEQSSSPPGSAAATGQPAESSDDTSDDTSPS